MPASSPPVGPADLESLIRLGGQLRDARKKQGVSAVAASEAAGISRVTLHRIENGEPSVTIGAWAAAAGALGLALALADPRSKGDITQVPERLRLDDYPQLKKLAWQLHGVDEVTPREALELYERNWRHVDVAALGPHERALVDALSRTLGSGRLLV